MDNRSIAHIHKDIYARRSPLAYSNTPIEPEKINALFEAARWAPSSFNEQPWRFIYALKEEPAEFETFVDCLIEGNRIWAQNAPMLVLSVARMVFIRNNKPNKHAFHDVGLAVGNLLLQATSMGLMVHQMGGYSIEKVKKSLTIPDGFEPVAVMAIGYPGNMDHLPENLKNRETQPRIRKPLDDLVFKGKMVSIL